ncbi:MAG: hypothetical protein RL563_317, partial [Pseudomonadota bacterium]
MDESKVLDVKKIIANQVNLKVVKLNELGVDAERPLKSQSQFKASQSIKKNSIDNLEEIAKHS